MYSIIGQFHNWLGLSPRIYPTNVPLLLHPVFKKLTDIEHLTSVHNPCPLTNNPARNGLKRTFQSELWSGKKRVIVIAGHILLHGLIDQKLSHEDSGTVTLLKFIQGKKGDVLMTKVQTWFCLGIHGA